MTKEEYETTLKEKTDELQRACDKLLASEDDTGCTDDLTVVDREPVEKIRTIIEYINWWNYRWWNQLEHK